jgi:TolA-binding protein
MRYDDALREMKRRRDDPPWGDLAERRVLARLERGMPRREIRVSAVAAALGIAAAIAAFTVFGITFWNRRGGETPLERFPRTSAAAMGDRGPGRPGTASVIHLSDGSTATIFDAAQMEIERQDVHSVRLAQASGRVRYAVVPNPAREFFVRTENSEIRVTGTVFEVEIQRDAVSIWVEEGTIEVAEASRTVSLSMDQEITLPRRRADGSGGKPPGALPSGRGNAVTTAVPPAAAGRGDDDGDARGVGRSIDELQDRADAARRAGDRQLASELLEEMIRLYPEDPRRIAALFSLGEILDDLGRPADAASRFSSCRREAPGGTLAEDAFAREAFSWQRAGHLEEARAAARAYVSRYPGGAHAARLAALAE